MLNKEKVKKFYTEGYNASEIAKSLKEDVEKVRKCIQRNFKDLKEKHEIAVIQRRETIKAINHEAKKFMSDKVFIEKNRSIYITKQNGDIVLDKSKASAITWDTPRRLTNENKCIV